MDSHNKKPIKIVEMEESKAQEYLNRVKNIKDERISVFRTQQPSNHHNQLISKTQVKDQINNEVQEVCDLSQPIIINNKPINSFGQKYEGSRTQLSKEQIKEKRQQLQIYKTKIQTNVQKNEVLNISPYQEFVRKQLEKMMPKLKIIQNYEVKYLDLNPYEQSIIKFDEEPIQFFDRIVNQNDEIIMELQLEEVRVFSEGKISHEQKLNFERDIPSSASKYKNQEKEAKSFLPKIMLNQQIDKNIENVLNQSGRLVNNKMIDAYALYLMQRDEKNYFKLEAKYRECYQRLFIFTSDFLTDCNIQLGKNEEKFLYLFLYKLQLFEAIQYQFQIIYQKIAVVINVANTHWFVAEINFYHKVIIIYDSLYKENNRVYQEYKDIFSFLFTQLIQQRIDFQLIKSQDFPQQDDFYSCGYFSCIALKYISQQNKRKQFVSKKDIKEELKNLLI